MKLPGRLAPSALAALLWLGLLACPCAASSAAPAPRIPVIISTDIGDDIDDTWALALALRCPELDLKLVLGDYGNPLPRARLIAKLLEAAGRTDVAVGVGVEAKFQAEFRQAKWIEGYDLDRYPGKVERDGVQAMIDRVMASPEPVTLLCIGPLPNIAEALRREPRIAQKARFVGMHGSVRVGYGAGSKPAAEWNVRANPAACRAALTAPWDITITPLDTCGFVRLRGEKYARVHDSADPLLRALMENYRVWTAFNTARGDKGADPATASSTLFDCVAVYLAVTQDLCVMERLRLRVDDEGFTREDPAAREMNVATQWKDLPAFEDWMVQRLTAAVPQAKQASAVALPAEPAANATASRQLITAGWDIPTPARFRAEVAAFEKWGLFAGTVIVPTRRPASGGELDCRKAFTRDHWERAEFTNALADLQAARPVTATNNYLYVLADPGDVDWFDDAGWREIVDHWRILAWLAKQGGLRGLHFHTEPYHFPPHSQFRYSAQAQRDRHTYDEYRAKARQRGREVAQAVTAEFPDLTLFFDRMFCDLLPLAASANPALALESHNAYGLQPAFVDGWLDVVPPTVTFVEGGKVAYHFTSQEEFDRTYLQLRTEAPRLLAPEHRGKFLSQLRVSFPVYLDAAAAPAGARWHLPPVHGSQAGRVEANVLAGLKASDDFVWFHGEKGRWWSGGNPQYPLWPEKIAGVDRALLRAAKPETAARAALAAAQPADNLLANAGFTATEADGAPAKWWTWQTDDEGIKGSQGRFSVRDGVACAEAMDNGCFGQFVPVKPGECYAVSVRARKTGKGVPALGVSWKTAAGQFTQEEHNVVLAVPRAEEWCDLATLARVPEGAAQMAVLLSVKRQTSAADLAQFDDARSVKVNP